MADPGDFAFAVNDEGGGDSFLESGVHPALGHLAVAALAAFRDIVDGDAIVHLVTHLLDKWFDLRLIVLVNGDADESDVLMFLLQLGEVRNSRSAWAAPSRPEFHDVSLSLFQVFDRIALDKLF